MQMQKYKVVSSRSGYEHIFRVGDIVQGIEEEGIFASDPYLVVYNEDGKRIAAAHLSRFVKVEEA